MYQTKRLKKNAKNFTEKSDTPIKKRNVLDFIQKEEIIKKIGQGFSYEKVANDHNIAVSTVYKLVQEKAELLQKHREENPLRKVFKNSDFPELDHALNCWFYQKRSMNTILSRPIRDKAIEFISVSFLL